MFWIKKKLKIWKFVSAPMDADKYNDLRPMYDKQ